MPNESAAHSQRRITYVCIPGSPFTGSTLLGSLLNEHPHCASMGEATGLIARVDLVTYRCSCGRRFVDCEFWKYLQTRTLALGYPVNVFETGYWNTHLRLSSNRLINAALVRSLRSGPLNRIRDALVGQSARVRDAVADAGWRTWSLATAVLERTGKSVFIDTSRDHQRPKYLANHPLLDTRVIHLIRDPRGNAASIMKHTGVDVSTAVRQWRHYNTEADRIRGYLPPKSWLSLHYEELCADPGGVLDRISDFLGVERSAMAEELGRRESHIIGNKMRMKGIGEIREDLSWQTRFGPAELGLIARIAGPTSRRLGYDWP